MKNSSIVAAWLAAAALLGATAPAGAAGCAFRADAPDQHAVVKGDTLWDIAGRFLDNPWCWPQVWGLNRAQIRDPHWIYPGQVIYLDRANGRLSLQPPGAAAAAGEAALPLTRLAPRVRGEALAPDALPAIAAAAIEPFLVQPLLVETGALARAPRIVASGDGRRLLGQGDRIYVRGALDGATSYQVFRPGKALTDPATGKVLAHEAAYLGNVSLVAAAAPGVDVHSFTITSVTQEMGVGDLLLAAPPAPVLQYAPHAPAQPVAAQVMALAGPGQHAGQHQVLTLNRGSLDGLDVGAVLQLYHPGKVVTDPQHPGWFGLGRQQLRLPQERIGTVFVFRVFDHVAYGLIMQAASPVQAGDLALSPE